MENNSIFEDNRKLKVVIAPVMAARLCNMGYPIVKLKKKKKAFPDDYNCDTVFCFEETEHFLKDFNKLLEEKGNL